MRIAIIGATGMLGHHATLAAAGQHELVIVHRGRSPLDRFAGIRFAEAIADLDDAESMKRALRDVEAVINCAGYYPTVPKPWREEVATATAQMENFYRACEGRSLRKIVYLGGAIALRRHPGGQPGDETLEYPSAPDNKNPYVQVKWAMDRQALEKARAGLPVVIGIPTMSFGEHDYGPTTGRLVVEIANGTLPGYVRGKRNVVYSGDAGRGMIRVCEQGRPGERYLLTGANLTMDELVSKIAAAARVDAPRPIPLPMARLASAVQTFRYRHLKGPLPTVNATAIAVMSAGQYLNGAKAERELGFRARVPVDEAIERALRWFREQGYVKKRA
jgi:nucleoside-diphosphate-sugar epimerase